MEATWRFSFSCFFFFVRVTPAAEERKERFRRRGVSGALRRRRASGRASGEKTKNDSRFSSRD
jgi:hypothetical protein